MRELDGDRNRMHLKQNFESLRKGGRNFWDFEQKNLQYQQFDKITFITYKFQSSGGNAS